MAGRLFEITLSYQLFQQQCITRWNYLADVVVPVNQGAAALATAFGSGGAGEDPLPLTPLLAIQTLVSNAVNFTDLTVRDVYSDFDFVEVPMGFAGLTSGEAYSPVMAYGFYSNRTRLDIRRGFKRIPGVAEGGVNTGGVIFGTALSNCQTLATRMGQDLNSTIGSAPVVWSPVIVSKHRYEPNPTIEPPKYAYEYYEDEAEQLTHIAEGITWTSYPEIRSQTSRQYNRGR